MPPTTVAVKRLDDPDAFRLRVGRTVVAHVREIGPLPGDGVAACRLRSFLAADILSTVVPGAAYGDRRAHRHDSRGHDHDRPPHKPSHCGNTVGWIISGRSRKMRGS